MPYEDVPVTRAMQPLKVKEYLATGKPVVVRDLPSTRDWSDCLDLASDAESFADVVIKRLHSGPVASQELARRRLIDDSWDAKARSFEQLVFSEQLKIIGVS